MSDKRFSIIKNRNGSLYMEIGQDVYDRNRVMIDDQKWLIARVEELEAQLAAREDDGTPGSWWIHNG